MTDDIVKKPFEEIEYQGKPARLYPNGVIRHVKGYVLYSPPEVSREMEVQQKLRRAEAVRKGIIEATQSETWDEAITKLTKTRTHVAMTDLGRAGNDAFTSVLRQAGLDGQERTVDIRIQRKQSYEIDEETRKLFDRIVRMKRGEDVDDDVIEAE